MVIPVFFGTTCVGLTHWLSEIGYITPTSSNLSTSFFTTSYIMGFRHLYIYLTSLASSSRKVLLVQRDELIPFSSTMVQPNAPLCYERNFVHLPSYTSSKVDDIMIEKVLLSLKNVYFSSFGSSFKSNSGNYKFDKIASFIFGGNDSNAPSTLP